MKDRTPEKRKASKAQFMLRLTEIIRIRLSGAKEWDVAEYVREQEGTEGSPWRRAENEKPLSRRSIRRYMQKADEVIAASTKERRRQALVKHLARREEMFAKAMNAGDIRTALAVADSEAKLRRLFPAAKHEVTGKDGAPLQAALAHVELSPDERARAVAGLLARLGAGDPRPIADGSGHGP